MKTLVKNHPAYHVWASINTRCYNQKQAAYKWYGEKGITVCDEWRHRSLHFLMWADESGYRKGLQIDRIDNTKGYSPENCRWVTGSVNSQNTNLLMCNNNSGYRGVTLTSIGWGVRIQDNGKRFWLGCYKTKLEAAMTYDAYVILFNTEHPTNIYKKPTRK